MRHTRLLRIAGAAAAAIAAGWAAAPAGAASNNIIVTYAGNGQAGSGGDGGPATAAQLSTPSGVVLDNAGNVFVVDTAANRVRKVVTSGTISTVAGTGVPGFAGDGGPAIAAKLKAPTGLAMSASGVLYVADTGNNRVRRVAADGAISTIAGTGAVGYTGDAGPATAAKLSGPTGLALDPAGDLFIADTGNDVVREVFADGTIVTFAGTGKRGFSGNTGPATKAKLSLPVGLTMSGQAVLISDTGNNQVREVSGGTITAFAGTGAGGFSGDGGQATAAQLSGPVGVDADPLGNVFVVDAGNRRIRQVTASGLISTFAGTGAAGFSGDGGPAELAMIQALGGISVSPNDVFFADTLNHRVRRVHEGGPPPALPEASHYQAAVLGGSVAAVLGAGLAVSRRPRRRRRVGAA